ncbi:tRNA/rRNA methyltransferase [Weissella oryzae SG25]|uniref:tRNA/rRNA methyltransferase n=1 Tax=Weissella oryzae (strain DSM 25784 / JCM 18191 / LMG 30913 / SG25) TaxID=1329250 RepID=A0A069CSQ8_WEIOS|nr:RsmF rRNA methyltransferase first C-terminal domain-containing protein [Weissella oryzae]GAK30514.1 tRNA/rRNA methyltransferase [Weissella oryzae SG25]
MIEQLPAAFKERYQALLGSEYSAFLAAYEKPISKAFRLNPLKANVTLYDTQVTGTVPWSRFGRLGAVNGHSVDHTNGVIYSQEPSAQYVGEVAQPKPGERVLDLAAAPGGKTTHLASFMQQAGLLVSNEIFRKRAQILSENVERFGVRNALVTNHAPAELAKHFPAYFDKIILDAPCSGEGMFRKDPAAIQYWHPGYPAENASRQREILQATLKMLKPGGELIYSTCTFAPEEDEQIIAWLLNEYPALQLIPLDKPAQIDDGRPAWADGNPVLAGTARLFPQHLDGEGHFVAKLRLSPDADNVIKEPKLAQSNLTKEQRRLWDAFKTVNMPDYDEPVLLAFGDQIYALPVGTPELKGLQVLRAGLHLGTVKKNRFEPSLALALAFHPDAFTNRYTVDQDEWAKYVHGDTFMLKDFKDQKYANGWYLLEINGNGTGFGKLVDGQMKNFYPKGLRFQVRATQKSLADDMY